MALNLGATIGVGVFVSAGFMATSLTVPQIMLAWVVGGVLAIAGAQAYGAVAALVPRSGGEYRYLSELAHPALGYLAGWTTLLVGFAAPVASSASIAGPFVETLWPSVDGTYVSMAMVVVVTLSHAFDQRLSRWSQDILAALKVALVLGFIIVGLAIGNHHAPSWTPPSPAPSTLQSFLENLVYVVYAYTGWNTAAYAAEEFRAPHKTVPRAMILSAVLVTALDLLLNWVMVQNLRPETLQAFLASDKARITVGHVITVDLLGPAAGNVMSALVALALFSGMSSMTLVGPRVFAAMAKDGYLPRAFLAKDERPPMVAVLLQGALSLLLVCTYTAGTLIANVGLILTAMSMLTVLTLFGALRRRSSSPRPAPSALVGAAVFAAGSGFMLYCAIAERPSVLLWSGAIGVCATIAYGASRRSRAIGPR